MPRSPLTFLSAILGTLLLTACSSGGPIKAYPGPARGPSRVATLEVPLALEVVYLDQRDPGLPQGLDDPYLLQLTPGQHSIHFAYVVDRGTVRQYEYAASALMAVSFDAVAGGRYRLSYREPAQLIEGQTLQAALVDLDSGASLPAQAAGNYQSALNRYLFRATPPPAPAASAPASAGGSPTGDSATLEQLQHWWRQATEDERAEFLNWVVRQ